MIHESLTLMADLTLLKEWAPAALQSGSPENTEDLVEVLRLRATVEETVAAQIDAEEAIPFLLLVEADRACAPYSYGLLYLDHQTALDAAGGELNPSAWWGIHEWEVTQEAAPLWRDQLNAKYGDDYHLAEVMYAFGFMSSSPEDDEALNENLRQYIDDNFTDNVGNWRTSLEEKETTCLRDLIVRLRSASAS